MTALWGQRSVALAKEATTRPTQQPPRPTYVIPAFSAVKSFPVRGLRAHREVIVFGAGRKGRAACPKPPSSRGHGFIDEPTAETKPLGLL